MTTPRKGKADYWAPGDWNALCDRCGTKFKASELSKTWEGLYCCFRCWEPRQPQDFVRAVADVQTPPWTRPPGTDDFIEFCTPNGMTAIAGWSIAGCWVTGYISPAFDPDETEPIY